MEQTFTPEDVKRHVERLDSRLSGVRRKVSTWFVVDGITRIFVWAAILIGVDMLLDWFFHMDRPQRVIMLGLMVAVLVIVGMRRILKPLSTRLTNRAICHEVEKTHPDLADRLTSAMELSRHEPGENISKKLTDAAIEDGFSASRGLEFNSLIRQDRFAINLVITAVVIVGIGLAATTSTFAIWFNRNIMLGDARWPQDYYLEIPGLKDGEMVIPKGDDWPIECVVKEGEKEFPSELWLELPSTEIRMEIQSDNRSFRALMRKVLEDTEARIVGDGGRTPWFKIRLVDRPSVENVSLSAPRPEYVGGVEEMPVGQGPYYLLKGSSLKVEGSANKTLSDAYVVFQNEDKDANFPLKTDGKNFSGEVPADLFVPGIYTLRLLDKEKVRMPGNSEPTPLSSKNNVEFTVRELPDRPPAVRLRLSGVGSMVVPGALIPYSVRIGDDYQATKAQIDFQWLLETAPEGTEPSKHTLDLPELVEANDSKEGDRKYDIADKLELSSLNISEGSSLSLEGVAFDNDNISGPKEGRSSKVLLRVVSESELRADLLRREMEDRQALEEITKLQDKAYTDTRSLQAAVRDEGSFTADHRSMLLKIQKRQKLLGANISPIIDRLEKIIQEYQNNRLVGEDGRGIKRLQDGAILHLTVILEQLMPEAALQLETVRRLSEDAEGREAAFTAAIEKQSEILEKLQLVLENLKKNEGFQQVINLLHDIAKEEGAVLKATEEAKTKRLEGNSTKKDSEGIDKPEESNTPEPNDK